MAKTKELNRTMQSIAAQRRSKNRVTTSQRRATRPPAVAPRVKKRVTAVLLQEMTRRLVNEFDPEQVILFGSYAWGTPTKDSDVDLMVIVSESDETEYQRMVRGLMCLEGMGVSKDVSVKTRAEFDFFAPVVASLEAAIVRKGKILYERGKKIARPRLVYQGAA